MDWRGLIAAILAGGLALTLVIGVSGAVYYGRPVSEKGGEVLVAICVATVWLRSPHILPAKITTMITEELIKSEIERLTLEQKTLKEQHENLVRQDQVRQQQFQELVTQNRNRYQQLTGAITHFTRLLSQNGKEEPQT